ncbi:hypothetical protein [Aeromonas veronii]|uniref:Arc family DNA-binding protein n=1 Tax=Aeromonas veronii TaxID=654 RepID=A0A4S5CKX7_AERVE|nr:hypothetical protein [Aeromonas veronii]THJ45045.1 hypothetical protein E8Q35_12735 [Aeromonas veronii]
MSDRKIVRTSLRLPTSLHELVISSAINSNRTMNAEIVNRLDFSIQKNLISSIDAMAHEKIQKTSLRVPVVLHDKVMAIAGKGFNDEIVRRLKGSFDISPNEQRELQSMGTQIASYPLRMEPVMREHFEMTAKMNKRSLHSELIDHLSRAMEVSEVEKTASQSIISRLHRVFIDDVPYHPETDVVLVQDPDLRNKLLQALSDPKKVQALASFLSIR